MKRIEAFIRSSRLEEVKSAVMALGHHGVTVMDVRGHGIQGGVSQRWRGSEYSVDLLPKTAVVLVVHDHELSDCLDVIARAARTGQIGDGKIFVTPVEDVIRIRTGESGTEAL